MTTKQNCMPCEGYLRKGSEKWEFSPDDSFCTLDWGRVCTPYALVWYWGNGSGWLTDKKGEKHLFGFEITWGIGDESNATETCIFYDGKAHKIGAVDVKSFPKPDKYMQPWQFISEDGRFNLCMQPFYDHHTDLNVLVMRMHSHQVHGLWNGTVTLDDGTVTELVFGIGVINENPVLGSAKWLKVDGMSNPLSGSSWTLTKYTDDTRSTVEHTWTVADDSTGASCTESSSVKCDTDSTSGTIKVESLEWGYYRVEEKDAPSGYIKTDEVWDFEIDARVSGKTNVEKAAAFVDPKERGDLPLTGAWFTPANLIRTGLLVAGAGAATWLIYRKYYASSKQE